MAQLPKWMHVFVLVSLHCLSLLIDLDRSLRNRTRGKEIESPDALYSLFTDIVRENLHIVLAMSPVGNAFRERLRKFPSLVNCCTIDWFQVGGSKDEQTQSELDKRFAN